MKRFKQFLVVCFVFLGAITLNAQDIHFSQFYMSPLNLNPAMTGVMNCNVRLVANYRNQWASVLKGNAYNTYSVSYDQKIPVGRSDYFGIGGSFWGDKAGESSFATLQGRLSLAYSKKMGGGRKYGNYLVVGAEVGGSQRSIDFLALRWGTQHDGAGGFCETCPTLEDQFNQDNLIFADVGAGLLWFSVFKGGNFYVGGAYTHLNRANVSFNDEEFEPLYSKFTLHSGGEFMISDRIGLVPGIVTLIQGPSFELNTGTSLKFLLGNTRLTHQAFQIGAWFRLANHFEESTTADALILSTRFDYNTFSLGFSYDINVSSLSAASNNNGAFEFALTYKICGPERRGVYCPDF
ncbi:MAG: PorP/SprF family type IX secretion system membrane protein [Saprospiraceae bacterium]